MDNLFKYFMTGNKIYLIIIAMLIGIIMLNGNWLIGIALICMYGILVFYNAKNTKHKNTNE